jgi:2-dehydro-3-deoxyphosphooctonate aldolase (KDO 8-P synthase)
LLVAAENRARGEYQEGQFLSPAEMGIAAEKVASTGNEKNYSYRRGIVWVPESRGGHAVVSDDAEIRVSVVFDVTHSVQLPGGEGKSSGTAGVYRAAGAGGSGGGR